MRLWAVFNTSYAPSPQKSETRKDMMIPVMAWSLGQWCLLAVPLSWQMGKRWVFMCQVNIYGAINGKIVSQHLLKSQKPYQLFKQLGTIDCICWSKDRKRMPGCYWGRNCSSSLYPGSGELWSCLPTYLRFGCWPRPFLTSGQAGGGGKFSLCKPWFLLVHLGLHSFCDHHRLPERPCRAFRPMILWKELTVQWD